MSAVRTNLPPRRKHETFEFLFQRGPADSGTRYTVGLGRAPDGRIGEVFLDCHKLSSGMTDDARDVAVTLSVALQHGTPLAVIASAVTRHEDGRPCGLTGRLVDAITEYEGGLHA